MSDAGAEDSGADFVQPWAPNVRVDPFVGAPSTFSTEQLVMDMQLASRHTRPNGKTTPAAPSTSSSNFTLTRSGSTTVVTNNNSSGSRANLLSRSDGANAASRPDTSSSFHGGNGVDASRQAFINSGRRSPSTLAMLTDDDIGPDPLEQASDMLFHNASSYSIPSLSYSVSSLSDMSLSSLTQQQQQEQLQQHEDSLLQQSPGDFDLLMPPVPLTISDSDGNSDGAAGRYEILPDIDGSLGVLTNEKRLSPVSPPVINRGPSPRLVRQRSSRDMDAYIASTDPKERLKLVRQRSYSNPVVPTIRQPAQDIDDDRQISHDSSSPSKSPVAPHHHIVPELTIAPSEPDIPSVNEEESPATGQQQYPSFLSLHELRDHFPNGGALELNIPIINVNELGFDDNHVNSDSRSVASSDRSNSPFYEEEIQRNAHIQMARLQPVRRMSSLPDHYGSSSSRTEARHEQRQFLSSDNLLGNYEYRSTLEDAITYTYDSPQQLQPSRPAQAQAQSVLAPHQRRRPIGAQSSLSSSTSYSYQQDEPPQQEPGNPNVYGYQQPAQQSGDYSYHRSSPQPQPQQHYPLPQQQARALSPGSQLTTQQMILDNIRSRSPSPSAFVHQQASLSTAVPASGGRTFLAPRTSASIPKQPTRRAFSYGAEREDLTFTFDQSLPVPTNSLIPMSASQSPRVSPTGSRGPSPTFSGRLSPLPASTTGRLSPTAGARTSPTARMILPRVGSPGSAGTPLMPPALYQNQVSPQGHMTVTIPIPPQHMVPHLAQQHQQQPPPPPPPQQQQQQQAAQRVWTWVDSTKSAPFGRKGHK